VSLALDLALSVGSLALALNIFFQGLGLGLSCCVLGLGLGLVTQVIVNITALDGMRRLGSEILGNRAGRPMGRNSFLN